jgi:catechol 2,3-dioxygenase-like lactoylglutathione lyase family enzyme
VPIDGRDGNARGSRNIGDLEIRRGSGDHARRGFDDRRARGLLLLLAERARVLPHHIGERVSSREIVVASRSERKDRMIETEGLSHVQLAVSDVRRSLEFYERVFGMQVQFWDGDDMVFIRTPGARDTITLNQGDPSRAGREGGVDHIGFRLRDKARLDDAIREVLEAGGHLVERGEHAPGQPFAYVADPDGFIIEL